MAITISENLKNRLTLALAEPAAEVEMEALLEAQAANVATIATADATDLATVITLANALKVSLNAEIAALKAAGLQASS